MCKIAKMVIFEPLKPIKLPQIDFPVALCVFGSWKKKTSMADGSDEIGA